MTDQMVINVAVKGLMENTNKVMDEKGSKENRKQIWAFGKGLY
jgi:hypothetical protein